MTTTENIAQLNPSFLDLFLTFARLFRLRCAKGTAKPVS
jgi:hypothetical protein